MVEVVGHGGQLVWRVGAHASEEAGLLRAVRGQLPDVRYQPVPPIDRIPSFGWELRTSSPRRPLRVDVRDELAIELLGAVPAAKSKETVILQWLIGPWLIRPVVPPAKQSDQPRSVIWNLGEVALDAEATLALRTKQKEPLFGVVGRIGVGAGSVGRAHQLRQAVVGALQLLRQPGVGLELRLIPISWAARRLDIVQYPLIAWPCTLSATELASCLGWPIGNPALPGLVYGGGRLLPPALSSLLPLTKRPQLSVRVTGRSLYPGSDGFLVQSIDSARHHTLLTGPTGVGKSNAIGGLALADIAAGRATVVIDLKGDLVTELADRIPPAHFDDVVLLEPGSQAPVGVNVLRGSEPDLLVDTVVHVMHELYAAHWGPRTADVMTSALATLTAHGGMTLAELPVLLTNQSFRRQVLAKTRPDDLGTGPFWSWFESLSTAEQASIISPTLNKVRAFTGRKAVRHLIGQSQGFDLGSIFRERKSLLVNLSKGSLGSEGAQLLGSLLVASIWNLAQRRTALPPARRHPVLIYLDEFHELLRLPVDLADALATARGLSVGFVLAHQNLGQLPPTIRSAALANARSRIIFACGHDDAVPLAKLLGSGLTPTDLQSLGRFETYQALHVDGVTAAAASARTLPLPKSTGSLKKIRQLSSERYGQPREDIDASIRARRQAEPPTSAVGRRPAGGRS